MITQKIQTFSKISNQFKDHYFEEFFFTGVFCYAICHMSQLSNLNLKIIWDFFVNFTISMTFNTWDFIDETIEILINL